MDFNQFILKNFVKPTQDAVKTARDKYRSRYNSHDTRSHRDLQRAEFSGIRANDLWFRFEFWILGNMHDSISYQEFALNPQLLNDKYMEIFGMKAVGFTDDVEKAIKNLNVQATAVNKMEEGDILGASGDVIKAEDFKNSMIKPKGLK